MHLANKTATPINPQNDAELAKHSGERLIGCPYYALLRAIADMLDHVAKGGEGYMVIGTTQDRSAVSVTVHLDAGKDAVYGNSLAEVADRTTAWL